MPKSTKILSAITIFLAIWAGFALFKGNKKDTLATEDAQFAVSDSGAVSKIIISLNQNSNVELTKPFETWMVNNSFPADDERMFNLMQFVYKARVKRPVYKEQINSTVNQLKTKGLKMNYLGVNGSVKNFWVGYFGGAEDELIALMDGFQTPYVIQVSGFNGNLAQILKPNAEAWKSGTIFSSKTSGIEKLKVDFNLNPDSSFEINKIDNKHIVKGLATSDSLRLYSYLQLFERVDIKEWLVSKNIKDSLSNLSASFEISLTDRNSKRSNSIKIYFKQGQKTNIYGLVGEKQELCAIRTSIFEYLLQKKSFFARKN